MENTDGSLWRKWETSPSLFINLYMADQEYTQWLRGLSRNELSREEWNLSFVLTTSSISNEAKQNAEHKLKLLKQVLNGTDQQSSYSKIHSEEH